MISSDLLVWEDSNGFPELSKVSIVQRNPISLQFDYLINSTFTKGQTVSLFEDKPINNLELIDYFVTIENLYVVIDIEDGILKIKKITTHDVSINKDVLQFIQRKTQSTYNYLSKYNHSLGTSILNNSSVGTLITTVGGIIHGEIVDFTFSSENSFIKIPINSVAARHLKYVNKGKLIVGKKNKKYYFDLQFDNLLSKDTHIVCNFQIISFSYGKQSKLDQYHFISNTSLNLTSVHKKIKYWYHALRIPFFVIAVIPILFVNLYLVTQGFKINAFVFGLIMTGLLFMLSGANLLNDFYDSKTLTDEYNLFSSIFSGDQRFIRDKLMNPNYARGTGILLLLLGATIGIYLNFLSSGFTILLLGGIGVFIAYYYTAAPLKFAYRGIGEILIGITFGPLIMIGTYVVQTRGSAIDLIILFFSIPVALSFVVIFTLNAFQSVEIDKISKKRTVVVRMGLRKSSFLVFIELLLIPIFIILNQFTSNLKYATMFGLLFSLPTLWIGNKVLRLKTSLNDIDKLSSQILILYIFLLIGLSILVIVN